MEGDECREHIRLVAQQEHPYIVRVVIKHNEIILEA